MSLVSYTLLPFCTRVIPPGRVNHQDTLCMACSERRRMHLSKQRQCGVADMRILVTRFQHQRLYQRLFCLRVVPHLARAGALENTRKVGKE